MMNKRKKIPCEECRNQKRRCNGSRPCERCGRLDLACVYLRNTSPDDDEFVLLAKEAQLNEQIAYLEDQMDELTSTMHDLRQFQQIRNDGDTNTTTTPAMTYDDDDDDDDGDDVDNLSLSSTKTIQHTQSYTSPVWTLEVIKGRLCFRTHVKTHSDLLVHAQNLASVIQLNDAIPSFVQTPAVRLALMQAMSTRMVRKTSKGRYQSALVAVHFNFNGKLASPMSLSRASLFTAANATTLSLVEAYLECQHLSHLAIHIPTFYSLAIESDTAASPALYAFCAVICTMDCDHIAKIVSAPFLPFFGQYYSQHAKTLLAERFDDVSLELLTTYIFMAVYQWNISNENKSKQYSDLALRMAYLLLPLPSDTQDVIHFYRIVSYLERTCVYEHCHQSQEQHREFIHLLEQLRRRQPPIDSPNPLTPLSTSHLTINLPRFLRYHQHRYEIHDIIEQASRLYDPDSGDIGVMVCQLSYHLECLLKKWYNSLESGYHLSTVPLFDATSISDEEYYIRVHAECSNSIIPALMTLSVYDELIVVGLGTLPKHAPSSEDLHIVQHLSEIWKGDERLDEAASENLGLTINFEKWQKRIRKLHALRNEIAFDGTDEEYVALIRESIYTGSLRYEYPLLVMIFHATLNGIRLSHYLQQVRRNGNCCYFDKRVVLSAKTMLTRYLIAGDDVHSKIRPHRPLIPGYLTLCDRLLQSEYSVTDDDLLLRGWPLFKNHDWVTLSP